jgi:hypothetical protein
MRAHSHSPSRAHPRSRRGEQGRCAYRSHRGLGAVRPLLQRPRPCGRSGLVFERCAPTPKTWGSARPSRLHIVRTLMPLAKTAPGPASPFTGSGTSRQARSWFAGGAIPTTANHDIQTARWPASTERSPLCQPCALNPATCMPGPVALFWSHGRSARVGRSCAAKAGGPFDVGGRPNELGPTACGHRRSSAASLPSQLGPVLEPLANVAFEAARRGIIKCMPA